MLSSKPWKRPIMHFIYNAVVVAPSIAKHIAPIILIYFPLSSQNFELIVMKYFIFTTFFIIIILSLVIIAERIRQIF